MLDGILLIVFFVIAGLAALLALFFFGVALTRRSRTMFKSGLAVAIVPLSICGILWWYYDVHIPRQNRAEEKAYAGSYLMIAPNSEEYSGFLYDRMPRLILNPDHSFQLDKNAFTRFSGRGTWRAGATEEGQFEFRDDKNHVLFWAYPSNHNRLEIEDAANHGGTVIFVK